MNYTLCDLLKRFEEHFCNNDIVFNFVVYEFMYDVKISDLGITGKTKYQLEKQFYTIRDVLNRKKYFYNNITVKMLRELEREILIYQYEHLSDKKKKIFLIECLESD